ncbi:Core-binding (CB) domain-containing protein [Vibrio crassostreae]|nr:Core-binding (CB) domain-containing protein [Vibrio crassostreae]
MSDNISYLHGWDSQLCIQLDTQSNYKADFNRFLVKNHPTTEQLQQGSKFVDADRRMAILRFKYRLCEKVEEGESGETLYGIFNSCSLYLRWCDKNDEVAFTQSSLQGYMFHEQTRVMLGQIKRSTYKLKHSRILVLFRDYLELPYNYFSNITIMDNRDQESFEAYTRSDLNLLLPFLRSLFKQTYKQFITSPHKHINSWKTTPTMVFEWKGKTYKLCSGISKMMCAGTYLLSYYTYANTSDLFQLKQPDNTSTTLGEDWYTMPAFKRRAFKTIQVEIGGHELDIPKYALSFFDNLLNASRIISSNRDATLLQVVSSGKVITMKGSTLQSFQGKWVDKYFSFEDQTGRKLRPTISRFRQTGSQLTAFNQGEMMSDIMLNNTQDTRKKSYSEGNRVSNNGMIQDAMSIREEQIKSNIDIKEAQANLGIEILVIEKENKKNFSDLSRTPNGGSCASPFGEKSRKYTKKAIKQGLATEGELLACADLLACFGCPSQVIVQSLGDIWCLLSFKSCIEESLYLHLDANHYRKNFEDIMSFIDEKILPNINSHLLKMAERKLVDEGSHPTWGDTDSVLHLIPKRTVEVQ